MYTLIKDSMRLDFLGYHDFMKPVITHTSALEYWRSVRIGDRTYKSVSSAKTLLNKPPHAGSFDKPGAWWLQAPLHVLINDKNLCRSSKNVVSHIWQGHLPRGAILDTRQGFCVCSPELTFLQMANTLDRVKLIELGFELCGTYDVLDGVIRSCAPLTNSKKLLSFASRANGMHGRKKTLRALQYVTESSASPRETILTMLLCLPYKLGGYGLDMPILNHRIDLDKKTGMPEKKAYYVCDLYWPKVKLAVEYDSDEFHTGVQRISQDSMRRTALANKGITVISVTNRQISSSNELKSVAHALASHLGKRLQYTEPRFSQACMGLRKALFSTNGHTTT